MLHFLSGVSALPGALGFTLVFVLITWACIFSLGPLRRGIVHRGHSANEMVGFTLASFSTLYGILLGLLAVEAYQDFSGVREGVSKEALNITTLHRDLDAYPPALRAHLRDELRAYLRETIAESWPAKSKSIVSGEAAPSRLAKIFNEMLAFRPDGNSAEIVHGESLRRINALMDMRRIRVASSDEGIPDLLWVVLFLGAFIHMALFALFDMERSAHLVLGATLAIFLGAAIFLIAALDDPFSGGVTIGPDAFESASKWMQE